MSEHHVDVADTAAAVGSGDEMEHLAPSAVGSAVTVTATVREHTERWLDCDVTAVEPGTGRLLARGTITRAIVDRRSFVARLR